MSLPKTVHYADYKPSNFLISEVELSFEIEENKTLVTSHINFYKNPKATDVNSELVLDFINLTILEIKKDGRVLTSKEYELGENYLCLKNCENKFSLTIKNEITPQANTSCEGLYISSNVFCTQCEAEGFRRITPFLDRPDVLAKYRVKIVADKKYPVLLSNGNLVQKGDLPNEKHFAIYEDPFAKPSYLFALVVGKFACL
jgi:aminopeptidase N